LAAQAVLAETWLHWVYLAVPKQKIYPLDIAPSQANYRAKAPDTAFPFACGQP